MEDQLISAYNRPFTDRRRDARINIMQTIVMCVVLSYNARTDRNQRAEEHNGLTINLWMRKLVGYFGLTSITTSSPPDFPPQPLISHYQPRDTFQAYHSHVCSVADVVRRLMLSLRLALANWQTKCKEFKAPDT